MPPTATGPPTTLTLDDAIAQLDATLTSHFDSLDQADAPTAELEQVAAVIKQARELMPSNGKPAVTRPSLSQVKRAAGQTHPTRKSATRRVAASVSSRLHIPTGEASVSEALYNLLRQGQRITDVPTIVASAKWDYPTDRQLPDDDAQAATNIIASAIGNMVAYGGICEPVGVDYSIPSFTTADRPIRDGLPSFGVPRGGVRFNMPFKLSDAVGGVTVWTQAMDTGGTAVKAVSTLACQSPQEQVVYGVATRTKLGNFQERYNPELVQAWLDATNAAAARNAELAILTSIEGGSTAVTYTGRGLGAARELLPVLEIGRASCRERV